MGKKTYYCNRCKHRHRYTSNKGKKHLEFKNTGRGTKDKYTYKSLSPIQKKIVDFAILYTKTVDIEENMDRITANKKGRDLRKILSFLIAKGELGLDSKKIRKGIRMLEKKKITMYEFLTLKKYEGYGEFKNAKKEYGFSKKDLELLSDYDGVGMLELGDGRFYLNKAKKYGFNRRLEIIK